MPPKKSTKKAAATTKPRASKMVKLAEKLDSVIDMLKTGKSTTAAVTKLETIKSKLTTTKDKKKSGELTEYQKFVKKNWDHKDLQGKDAPSKMKAIGQMWKKEKK